MKSYIVDFKHESEFVIMYDLEVYGLIGKFWQLFIRLKFY